MKSEGKKPIENGELSAIVDEVVSEAHLSRELILPEEIEYIQQHVLKKPLGVIHVWALGVGVVITGEYFGWNFGLPVGGPAGVLIASPIVCAVKPDGWGQWLSLGLSLAAMALGGYTALSNMFGATASGKTAVSLALAGRS